MGDRGRRRTQAGAGPRDPGGQTKWGISAKAFPKVDIPNLTREDAEELYRKHYWDACRCAEMHPAVAEMVFDAAVNQGVAAAGDALQRALVRLGVDIRVDTVIGPATVKAAQSVDPQKLTLFVARWRAEKYARLVTFARFGSGWMERLFALLIHTNRHFID